MIGVHSEHVTVVLVRTLLNKLGLVPAGRRRASFEQRAAPPASNESAIERGGWQRLGGRCGLSLRHIRGGGRVCGPCGLLTPAPHAPARPVERRQRARGWPDCFSRWGRPELFAALSPAVLRSCHVSPWLARARPVGAVLAPKVERMMVRLLLWL